MKTTLLVLLLTIALGTTFATTTSELVISNAGGTVSCTISSGGAVGVGGGCAGFGGTITIGASSIAIVNGTFTVGTTVWDLNVVDGVSNSPTTNPGLDVTNETAVCVSACTSNAELDTYYSDIGFTTKVTGFTNGFSTTDTGSGSASQKAWDSSTDTLLAETTAIGAVGPFVGAGVFAGSVVGPGPQGPAAYSLTLEQIFVSDEQNDVFSADGNITGVPEPGAVVLLGTVLVFCASKLRRRRTA